jgi:hypothetical protein
MIFSLSLERDMVMNKLRSSLLLNLNLDLRFALILRSIGPEMGSAP